jgi:hypothetical protein
MAGKSGALKARAPADHKKFVTTCREIVAYDDSGQNQEGNGE